MQPGLDILRLLRHKAAVAGGPSALPKRNLQHSGTLQPQSMFLSSGNLIRLDRGNCAITEALRPVASGPLHDR
ncbi:hypothetical protein D0Z66_19260 [Cereibacter sphaeroides]|uniref:Uncharacterized protein n=1 Tax=Cereibacter azotoformans TaxID=43057 RepID=A0A2T5K6B8_9RHOB|nr:hypothetical protein D0Z66_19260 [Cereibacter sphaeroides]PTR17963.1 hypothetical protein C8J28_11087 [Cereibacter azotoformans]